MGQKAGMRVQPERKVGEKGSADPERRAILLDFDHTLFDTDRFFWVDLRSAFARFGVPDDAWEMSYEVVWPLGYSLAKHLDELERLGVIVGHGIRRTMLATLEAAFSDLRIYLFPDVPAFLKAARHMGFDLILLSFGDPAWQSYKVRGSGLSPLFQKIVYTAKQGGKGDLLDDLSSSYAELRAIDNNPADLDSMKTRHPNLQTHLICRVKPSDMEGPGGVVPDRLREAARYLSIPSRLSHHRCWSLDEVRL
jgi:phosphoglycolate phosphatase-like HAD superfamily hydrolase